MEKKKVGIVTIFKIRNNGSLLQAYATEYALMKLGYSPEIINYLYPNKFHHSQGVRLSFFKRFISLFKHYTSKLFFKFLLVIFAKNNRSMLKFQNDFINKHLILSKQQYNSPKSIRNNPPTYDIYLSGSDQIWNPRYSKGDTVFMLDFVANNAKKIAYSSSIALESLPQDMIDIYKKYLSQYSAISLREKTGVELVEKMISNTAPTLVCDPVMLLKPQDWSPIIKESKIKIKKPYILSCILTYSYDPYPHINDIITQIKNKTGFNLVQLYISNTKALFYDISSTKIVAASPSDFLTLIKNAEVVLTTSFHCSIFSLIFNRQLFCYTGDNDTRLEDLLNRLGCSHRIINAKTNSISNIPDINYEIVNKNIDIFRQESYQFLKDALEN